MLKNASISSYNCDVQKHWEANFNQVSRKQILKMSNWLRSELYTSERIHALTPITRGKEKWLIARTVQMREENEFVIEVN